ncbi:hypothetical protein BGX28_001580 [Mortierella sp. GBA30]|nr:hypothetical protein BGX28_001580 [Mortierella sp. GBA30]
MLSLSSSSPSSTQTTPTATPAHSCAPYSVPLQRATNYKQLVATFTASAPQPYGTIPPRRKMASARRARSSSVSSSHSSLPSTTAAAAITLSSRSSIELVPTNIDTITNSTTTKGTMNEQQQNQSLLPSLQSFLKESISFNRSRGGLWSTLKTHYLTSTYNLPWNTTLNYKKRSNRRSTGSTSEFSPVGLLVSRSSSPVVTLDARPLVPASSSAADDALLSLPNLDSLELQSNNDASFVSGSYPVSVAAMDKFKVVRSDTIPLKTFTYRETPVAEVIRNSSPVGKRMTKSATPGTSVSEKTAKSIQRDEKPLPLPRHLAAREMRSNSDYLRMMASEMRMVRSRKLIAPLKPRGYLPRRKELFRSVKSSLSVVMEMPSVEDDHPLNNLLVGSWSSTDSFLSTTSSDYATADEEF